MGGASILQFDENDTFVFVHFGGMLLKVCILPSGILVCIVFPPFFYFFLKAYSSGDRVTLFQFGAYLPFGSFQETNTKRKVTILA